MAIKWTTQLENAICTAIIAGDSIRTISARDSMPGMTSIFKHLNESEEFVKQYARARELQAEAMLEEILEIADETAFDTKTIKHGDHVTEVADSEWINRSRLRVDTRKWAMSKLAPKKYGDKVQQEVSGPAGGPIQASITVQLVKSTLNLSGDDKNALFGI